MLVSSLKRLHAKNTAEPTPAAQQPVAWVRVIDGDPMKYSWFGSKRLPVGKHLLYTAPPSAEQPYSATSDKYRAELYDEVWETARSMGYGNVTMALAELERRQAAEQPDTVKVPRELLERHIDEVGEYAWDTDDEMRALLGKDGER